MELFSALGLDYRLLIAQFLNFAILLFILYKIGYKPIIKFIEDRKNIIAQGIDNAEEAAKTLKAAKNTNEELIADAHRKAKDIVENAKLSGREQKQKEIDKGKEELERLIANSKKEIKNEKERILSSVKEEIIELAIFSAQEILKETVNKKIDKAWVARQLEKHKI